MEPIHNRMPVILPASAYAQWLEPGEQDPTSLQALIQPYPRKKCRPIPSPPWSTVQKTMWLPLFSQHEALKAAPWGPKIARVLSAALEAVEPETAISRHLQRQGDHLLVDGTGI